MEITGFGTEVVISGYEARRLVEFVQQVARMWPEATFGDQRLADIVLEALAWPVVVANPMDRPEIVENASDILPFARDAEMDEFWEENGYAAMPDGEGPFSIFFRRQSHLDWDVEVLHAHDAFADTVGESGDRRRLLIRNGVIITIVTPEDPDEHPFSRRVIDLFLSCFTAAAA